MNLQEMRMLHSQLIDNRDYEYMNSWTHWNLNHEDTLTIYMVIDGIALIETSKINWNTGKYNNVFATRKVKDGKIKVDGENYLVKYPKRRTA